MMKRLLSVLVLMAILMGCAAQTVTPAPKPDVQETPAEESVPAAQKPVPAPEVPKAEQPELPEEPAEPEKEPDPAPAATPAPAPNPQILRQRQATQAYLDITRREQFSVVVQDEDGALWEIDIVQGVNDWNVAGLEGYFDRFDWSAAAEADWETQTGVILSLTVPGEASFSCRKNSDLIKLTTPEETLYLRAVKSAAAEDVYLTDVYSLLDHIGEDAYYDAVWHVTADGTLAPQEAARTLTEAVAAGYAAVPDWIGWKPLEVRAAGAEVFDLYYGEPQQFCFNLGIQIRLEDPLSADTMAWQVGSGLGEPDEEGWYSWGRQVLAEKNADGNWSPVSRGTGGYSVNPVKPDNRPQLDWLVELFCLTEGFTHDHIAPYLILERSEEELARLPELLDQLTEQEGRALCLALQKDLRDGHAIHTEECLTTLLGDYAAYLDA